MNKIVLVVLVGVCSLSLLAKENVGTNNTTINSSLARVAADCTPSEAMTDLNINNVRTTIMGASDMWWNLTDGKYEIPKDGGKHSMFAGSLWIAGIDAGNQLKAAAMTYRQTGNDYWTGPLDESGNIDAQTCADYDQHFQITRQEVDDFIAWFNDKTAYPEYNVPNSIKNWPANGLIDGDFYQFLAPFEDVNGDGEYNPEEDGDYPKYDINGNADCTNENLIFGDQTLWWVFNDKGNIHSETGAEPIGLEIRAQAFAFATNDEINNMTFYNYEIINKATIQLNDAYFGQWVDPDLGKYDDDYVGCDVARGFGYCYNGDDDDDGASGYGLNPPAIGVDFFQGPLADIGDGVDNDRDSIIDEPGEQSIMSRFVYYNNDFSVTGNPENGQHIYNYLIGKWKDGLDITYGDEGRGGTINANFMFPGDSDPYGWGTDGQITEQNSPTEWNWTEESAGTEPDDRRFVQSAGPFTLEPGATNKITTGVVWSRAVSGGAFASVELARIADDKAQALFDNCFNVLNGPDAPDVEVIELDQQLAFNFSNSITSNNFLEQYLELDPLIISPPGQSWDPYYRFQGYQFYQLASQAISVTDLDNPDLARLVFQTDLEDEVSNLVNYNFDVTIGANVPTLEVSASNLGISHSINILEDEFATGNKTLVNNKTYYFMAVAYGYNEYKTFDSNNPELLDGQQRPYKAGRKNIKVYSAIPHKPFTTQLNSEIGDGVPVTKILGAGNGANALELTSSTEATIMASATYDAEEVSYVGGKGPVDIQVIDPYHLTQADFALKLYGDIYDINVGPGEFQDVVLDANKARWELINLDTDESYFSDATINFGNQQLFPDLGFSIEVQQVNPPEYDYALVANSYENNNGFISSSITYQDEFKPWLGGVSDIDDEDGAVTAGNSGLWGYNWIHAGAYASDPQNETAFDDIDGDPEAAFEAVVNGTWAPYRFVSYYKDGPGFDVSNNYTTVPFQNKNNEIKYLESVKVVYTSDKSMWSRCVVLESQDNPLLAEGNAEKMDKRAAASVDQDGVAETGTTGLGWFPGYAISKETGERLNIMFSEDSWLQGDNGNDMRWNPSSRVTTNISPFANGSYYLGGKHFVYVHSSKYDECHAADSILSITNNLVPKRKYFAEMMWVNVPLLNVGYDFPLFDEEGQDVAVNIDVSREYRGLGTVDETEYTELIQLPISDRTPLKDLLSEYDQLFAYDVDVSLFPDTFYVYATPDTIIFDGDTTITIDSTLTIAVIDSVLVNDVWTPGTDLSNIYYTSTLLGSPESVTEMEVTYKKVNYPSYRFNTSGLMPTIITADAAVDSIMDLVNIVPNPYYAYSEYEGVENGGQLDNRVRITNLPDVCTISIYTLNGSLVKKLEKDSEGSASIDWDLKNQKGIPIAGGAYIVNVYVPSLGKEKNLKWFGVMRPIDLDTF